jgi:uncharacterized membrane protein
LLVVASVISVSLGALRPVLSGAPRYENLVWNLVLPFLLALIAYERHRHGSRGLALWLAFPPNAPYLVF